jgi:hypothetical protein
MLLYLCVRRLGKRWPIPTAQCPWFLSLTKSHKVHRAPPCMLFRRELLPLLRLCQLFYSAFCLSVCLSPVLSIFLIVISKLSKYPPLFYSDSIHMYKTVVWGRLYASSSRRRDISIVQAFHTLEIRTTEVTPTPQIKTVG